VCVCEGTEIDVPMYLYFSLVQIHFSPEAQQPLVVEDLSFEASRLHPDTPHSAGLLWTRDQPDAETST
jgi:hypothetical protein